MATEPAVTVVKEETKKRTKGQATLEARLAAVGMTLREFYSQNGKKGGESSAKKGKEFYHEIGIKGGKTTRDRNDPVYFAELGRRGGITPKGEGKGRRALLRRKTKVA